MGVHVPVQAHAHSRISTSYMSHDPRDPYGPGAQHDQRHVIMSLNPPASPEPEMAISMPLNLDPLFPMVWRQSMKALQLCRETVANLSKFIGFRQRIVEADFLPV